MRERLIMSALEDEIVSKFRLLDHAAQERVLRQMEAEFLEAEPEHLGLSDWLIWARQFRAKHLSESGANRAFNAVDTLAEVREERLNDLMGRG
jgi:putative hemolysin